MSSTRIHSSPPSGTDLSASRKRGITPSARRSGPRKKVRASVACDVCRVRKVRCSVANDGPPCTNCRLDGIDCTIPSEGRARKKAIIVAAMARNRIAANTNTNTNNSQSITVNTQSPTTTQSSSIPQPTPQAAVDTYTHQPTNRQPSPPQEPQTSTQQCPQTRDKGRDGWRTYAPEKLPSFIKPISTPSPPGVHEFLSINEAFSFPASEETRLALVDGFIRGVHCIYPLYDTDELLQLAVQSPLGESRIRFSLLTYQAMLLAAIPFVSDSICRSLGFESHIEARLSLYRRTKVIYDADIEHDVADIARTLILLSHWNEGGGIQRDSWYWTGCLASVVEKAEPWRNLDSPSGAAMSRTLWWCCLARDAHVALVIRRPPRLYRFHTKVPFRSLQDASACVGDSGQSKNKHGKMETTAHLTLTAWLATIIAKILQNESADLPEYSPNPDIFKSCERELAAWSTEFSATVSGSSDRRHRSNRQTGPFISLSLMAHDTAINALYLPRVLRARRCLDKSVANIPLYMKRMRRAAIRTAVLIDEALRSDWADSIPTQIFTSLISAIPVHIVGLNSSKPGVATMSLRCLGTCLRLLCELQSRFGLARHLQQDIINALSKMNIDPTCHTNGVDGSSPRAVADSPGFFHDTGPLTPETSNLCFTNIGDPFNDTSWGPSNWGLLDMQSNASGSPGDFLQDGTCRQSLEDTANMTSGNAWIGRGTEPLSADSFSHVPDLQSWFDDVFIIGS